MERKSPLIGSLGDRLLAAVVPKAKASATPPNPYCWYQYLNVPVCVRRYCCDPPGSTPVTCTQYRNC